MLSSSPSPSRARREDRRLNPIVCLDVDVGGDVAGRLVIELRADVVPKTSENFRRLCTGETRSAVSGKRRQYANWCASNLVVRRLLLRLLLPPHKQARTAGSPIHRVVRDKFCQSGDFLNHDGTGGESAFDQPDDEPREVGAARGAFKDENFVLKHTGAGVLSMANAGPDTNTSLFYLHFAPAPAMDGKHVVFGSLMGEESFRVLNKIHRVATEQGDPKLPVRITASGQLFPN